MRGKPVGEPVVENWRCRPEGRVRDEGAIFGDELEGWKVDFRKLGGSLEQMWYTWQWEVGERLK